MFVLFLNAFARIFGFEGFYFARISKWSNAYHRLFCVQIKADDGKYGSVKDFFILFFLYISLLS